MTAQQTILAPWYVTYLPGVLAWDAWRHWLNRKTVDEYVPEDDRDKTDPIWKDK